MSKNLKKVSQKHKVFGLVRDEGLSIPKAAKTMGYSEAHGYAIEKVLRSHGLSNPRKIKLASSAVNSLLSGERIGESDPPNPETIRRTAEMVFDRAEPKEVRGTPDTVNLAVILQQAHESMKAQVIPPMLPMSALPSPAPRVKTEEEREEARKAYSESRSRRFLDYLSESEAEKEEEG